MVDDYTERRQDGTPIRRTRTTYTTWQCSGGTTDPRLMENV